MKKIKDLNIFIKILLLLLICIVIGTFLLFLVYFLPIDRILRNAEQSIDIYDSQLITMWSGWTRYSHLSNHTDLIMIAEAICRKFNSNLTNALLNPRLFNDSLSNDVDNLKLFFTNQNSLTLTTYPRYWHGYLLYIIPGLFITNAGGIRTIMMFVQFFLTIFVMHELNKKKTIYMLLFAVICLFINPVTTILTFQEADIYIITMIFMIIMLRYNEWLNKNNRYILLFTLNGIVTTYFDFLTYPLVAWGIPITLYYILNKNNFKKNIRQLFNLSIAWIIGYAGMWLGKWIVADLLTDTNVIKDAFDSVLYRTVGDNYSYIETLSQIINSVNDVPMLCLYLLDFIIVVCYVIKNKLKLNMSRDNILSLIPLLIIFISPFVWYFVVRNHAYVHPWMEYRNLAITLFSFSLMLIKLFDK